MLRHDTALLRIVGISLLSELPEKMRGVWLTGHGDLDKLDVRSDTQFRGQVSVGLSLFQLLVMVLP